MLIEGAAGSNPTGDNKLFAKINLPFFTKQYKNDNIANFEYYWNTRVRLLSLVLPNYQFNVNLETYKCGK